MKTIHDKLCDLHLNKLGNLRTCEKLNASHDLIEQLTLHASAAKFPPFSNFTVARCIHNIHIMISIVRINKTNISILALSQNFYFQIPDPFCCNKYDASFTHTIKFHAQGQKTYQEESSRETRHLIKITFLRTGIQVNSH